MIKGKAFQAKRFVRWEEVLTALFLLFLFPVSKSWAVGNLHLGLIEIHPGLQVKRNYYQTIYEDNPDLGGDWITTFSSGIRAQWPIRQHTIKCDWAINFPRYSKNTDWNYTGQQLSTSGNFVFGQGGRQMTLDLGYNKAVTDEPADLGETRRKHKDDKLSSKLGINLNNNLRLDFSYDLNTYTYDDYRADDREDNQFGTAINVRVQPKTEAFISGRHYQLDYKEGVANDSSVWTIGPGIRWDATAKLSGQISGGFAWRDYKEREKINTWVVMVDLTHKASDFTRVSLGIDKGERDHSIYNYEKNAEDFDTYAFHQLRISFDHQLTYKIKALSGFTYEYDKYHGIERQDHLYSWRLGLKYQIQEWLVTDMGFEQRNRTCGGDSYRHQGYEYLEPDYNNNIYSFSLGLVL